MTIANPFQRKLHESNCKSDKTWIDRSIELYNRPTKSCLQDNDIEMY